MKNPANNKVKITKYQPDSPKLWGLIGPLAFRKDVIKDLGGNLSNDDNYTWYIAADNGKVLGFAATEQKVNGAWIRHCWVDPDHRKGTIYMDLLEKRLDDIWATGNLRVTCICDGDAKKQLEKKKFVCTTTRGRYFTMRLEK